VEDGLWYLERLAALGVTVLNPPNALRLAHDKLLSATALTAAGLPHPRTLSVGNGNAEPPLPFPFVLKPRFGSWGRDVVLCENRLSWRRALMTLATRDWFSRTGALAQELVPPLGHDLRILVARGKVIGGDLVGVDLLPAGPGRYAVLEMNGAVDFTPEYALRGDIFAAATGLLVGKRRLAAIA